MLVGAAAVLLSGCAEPAPTQPTKSSSEPSGRNQEKNGAGDEKR